MMNVSNLSGKIWILVGTRPEVIKQVPVYKECQRRFGSDKVALVGTGQHRELLEQALAHFDVRLDFNLDVMLAGATLSALGARLLERISNLIRDARPKLVVVQGDTLSAFAATLACFLEKIPVAHNEAGLRSHDLQQPFPEEGSRRLISVVADLHLAPTELAANELRNEGVNTETIKVVGNPVVDSLFWTLEKECASPRMLEWKRKKSAGLKLALVTSHRRENADAMHDWYQALNEFVLGKPEIDLICPIHPNNLARNAAESVFKGNPRIELVDPLDYLETCHLISMCHLVVTDSGGIQEEASTLGIPVVVCRKKTERMEAVYAGLSLLVDPSNQKELTLALEWAYAKGDKRPNPLPYPYGSGDSARRIVDAIAQRYMPGA